MEDVPHNSVVDVEEKKPLTTEEAKGPLLEVRRARPSMIGPGPSPRPISTDRVDALAESIASRGLLNPITVRRWPFLDDRFEYQVVAGHHRLLACQQLGDEEIAVNFVEADDADAMLIGIDENLLREELTLAETALSLGVRKELYEERNFGSRRGAAGGNARQGNEVALGFAKKIAASTKVSERTIRRSTRWFEAIPRERLRDLVGTSLDSVPELDALATIEDLAKTRSIKLGKTEVRLDPDRAAALAVRIPGLVDRARADEATGRKDTARLLLKEFLPTTPKPSASGGAIAAVRAAARRRLAELTDAVGEHDQLMIEIIDQRIEDGELLQSDAEVGELVAEGYLEILRRRIETIDIVLNADGTEHSDADVGPARFAGLDV